MLLCRRLMQRTRKKSKGTALITGGAKRIGRAIALALAKEGYGIALHYHSSRSEAQALAAEIHRENGTCRLYSADLTNEAATLRLIKAVKRECADLNVLINSASIYQKSKLRTATLKQFNDDLNIHVKAPFILTQGFAHSVKKGVIINMLDTKIIGNETEFATYLLAKKCLASLTSMSALEFAPGIRVNAVAPGPILPPPGKGMAI